MLRRGAPQCPSQSKTEPFGWAGATPEHMRLITGPEVAEPEKLAMEIVVNAVEKEFNVDKNRIYVAGVSMGGYGVWDLITRYPDKFAAAIPICGGGEPDKVARNSSAAPALGVPRLRGSERPGRARAK